VADRALAATAGNEIRPEWLHTSRVNSLARVDISMGNCCGLGESDEKENLTGGGRRTQAFQGEVRRRA